MKKEVAHKFITLLKAFAESTTDEQAIRIEDMIFTTLEKECNKALNYDSSTNND